jgi:hypothetical protein
MKQIEIIVGQVWRRLFLQDLVTRLPFYLLGFLGVATVAVVVPKLIYWEPWSRLADTAPWLPAWGTGAVLLAILLCLWSCWRTRASRLRAAEELDQRFGLQQRVSSTLASSAETSDPDFYAALLRDTQRKIEHLQIRDQFPIHSRWPLALPLIPILLLVGSAFVPNIVPDSSDVSAELTEAAREELKNLIKTAKVKNEDSTPDAEAEMEGAEIVKQAMSEVEKVLNKKDVSKREVLVAFNDVKKALQDQQDRLGKTEALKERLNRLKDQTQGPADKFNKALQDGNTKEAQEQLSQLAEKMANGEMGREELQKLGKQMEAMNQQLGEMNAAFEKQKQDLQRQIDNALAEGNLDRAAELEKKKAGLEQQQRQMNQLKELAEQAEKVADMLKQLENGQELGEAEKQAIKEALQNMQQQVQEMDLDEQQMKELQNQMNQMEEMKQKMRGQGQGEGQGDGEGEGEGEGEG